MKKVTSFTHLITGEGDRIAFTYSEMDTQGAIVSQNNKKNFVVTDKDVIDHINAIKSYIKSTFLKD